MENEEPEVKSMLIISFDINGIVHKEFVLVVQAVNSANYCGIVWQLRENMRRLCPENWRQRNCLLHRDNAMSHTSFFKRVFFTKNEAERSSF
jgi:hypothetical protein